MRLTFIISLVLLLAGSMPTKAQIDTDRMLVIGRNAIFFEDYILAIQYFNQVIAAKPFLSEPFFLRALGKYNLEDHKGALIDVDRALEINPFHLDAYILRGVIRQELGKSDQALSDFKRGLEIDPGNVNFLMNIGIVHINNSNYQEAISSFSEVLRFRPNFVPALLNRGHARIVAKDTLGGLDDFNRAIALNSRIPDGYSNRAMVYYLKNDFQRALQDLDSAIILDPDNPRLYMNRGVVRYQLDDLRGTVADFDRVIELDPRNAVAYSNRGILRAQIGDTNRAIEDFSRVLALNSNDLLTLYYRAVLYAQVGEYRAALADFNVIAEYYPDFSPLFFNRSQVKYRLGDRRGAEADYLTGVRLDLARRQAADSQTTQVADASDKLKGNTTNQNPDGRKETRRQSDTDIRNYNRIAVLDDFGTEQHEETGSNPLRGRIQDRDIEIELEQFFGLTFFPGDTLMHRLRYFDINVDAINRRQIVPMPLQFANVEKELSRQELATTRAIVDDLTRRIENARGEERELLLFARGAMYIALLDLNNALEDYNLVVGLNPSNFLALFNRAYVRLKMVELVRQVKNGYRVMPSLPGFGGQVNNLPQIPPVHHRVLDFDLVVKDLQRVLELEPRFAFANFNLAMVNIFQQDYENALENFTRAIESRPGFAEAYYNRGLTRIFLNDTPGGTLDLSKAGELGIFKAYNVIQRYGARPGSPETNN